MKYKYILSGLQRNNNPDATKEDKLMFADFFINKSPWKKVFVEQTPEDVVNDEMWIIDANNPANLIANACVATRIISEFPAKFKAWRRMVKTGIDETLAFFMCHYVAARDDDGEKLIITGDGGHVCFESSFDKHYFNNFLNGNYQNEEPHMSEGIGYRRINNIWGIPLSKLNSYKLSETIRPRDNGKVVNLDIFYRSANGEHAFITDFEVKGLAEDFVKLVNEKG